MANLVIKVSNPQGGVTYLPLGCQFQVVDEGSGKPMEAAAVFVDNTGVMTSGPASDLPQPKKPEPPPEPAPETSPPVSATVTPEPATQIRTMNNEVITPPPAKPVQTNTSTNKRK